MGLFQSFFGPRGGAQIAGVNAIELNELLENGEDFLLVDVRSPAEYAHDGHIEGAKLIPLQELFYNPNELPKDKEIIFVCRSGNRSMVACQQMAQQGYSVKNFNGGMIAWHQSAAA